MLKNKFISFVSLLVFLCSISAFGATAQVNDVAVFGGPTSNSSGNQIVTPNTKLFTSTETLVAQTASSTSNNFLAFGAFGHPAGSATQYQVPGGVQFCTTAISIFSNAGAGSVNQLAFGYGTAALLANDTPTPPVGLFEYGATTGSGFRFAFSGATSDDYKPFFMCFPSGSFPYFRFGGASNTVSITLIGQLQ